MSEPAESAPFLTVSTAAADDEHQPLSFEASLATDRRYCEPDVWRSFVDRMFQFVSVIADGMRPGPTTSDAWRLTWLRRLADGIGFTSMQGSFVLLGTTLGVEKAERGMATVFGAIVRLAFAEDKNGEFADVLSRYGAMQAYVKVAGERVTRSALLTSSVVASAMVRVSSLHAPGARAPVPEAEVGAVPILPGRKRKRGDE